MERIDKILAAQGRYSRREIKKLVRDGQIAVNGVVITDSSVKIDEFKDTVTLSGEPIALKKHIYIMLNKPQGIVSASESGSERTVIDLVPEPLYRKGLFPAGRLDKDTTGFVLITDDGDFAHRILSPKNHIYKTYLARLEHRIGEAEIKMLENGITLADGTVLKEAKTEIAEDTDTPLVRIMICEGKYHQVKRMFAAAGNRVISLHRQAMGGLMLDASLMLGECREITADELRQLENEK
ncbi:MAG: rRNA pseudouridine synthase [Oscillospiraceae bacterium]|nr:rRNA pseudouridine synthase [Oscillospiraceae bacterium]